jgi:DNA-binding CsgD family transcriptional regulator
VPDTTGLTRRDLEVLALIAEGRSTKQIAWQLAVTERAVKWHLTRIYQRLEVDGRVAAVVVALQRGLVSAAIPASLDP